MLRKNEELPSKSTEHRRSGCVPSNGQKPVTILQINSSYASAYAGPYTTGPYKLQIVHNSSAALRRDEARRRIDAALGLIMLKYRAYR